MRQHSQSAFVKRILVRGARMPQHIRSLIGRPKEVIDGKVTNYLNSLGFLTIHRHIVHGPRERLHLGNNRVRNNIFFNTRSGHIYLGDGAVFGYNCMLLTGVHLFEDGQLKKPGKLQVPSDGYDIRIGRGCWIASGAIIIGGVTIGDDCIIAAGAVVTRDFAAGSIIGGVPARVIGSTHEIGRKTIESVSAATRISGGPRA